MLKKSLRYTTAEFKQVFANNQSSHGSYFIRLAPTDGLVAQKPELLDKYAVVVSKKTYSRRVDRNLVRRFVYQYLGVEVIGGGMTAGGIVILRKDKTDYAQLIKDNPDLAREKLRELYSN